MTRVNEALKVAVLGGRVFTVRESRVTFVILVWTNLTKVYTTQSLTQKVQRN